MRRHAKEKIAVALPKPESRVRQGVAPNPVDSGTRCTCKKRWRRSSRRTGARSNRSLSNSANQNVSGHLSASIFSVPRVDILPHPDSFSVDVGRRRNHPTKLPNQNHLSTDCMRRSLQTKETYFDVLPSLSSCAENGVLSKRCFELENLFLSNVSYDCNVKK